MSRFFKYSSAIFFAVLTIPLCTCSADETLIEESLVRIITTYQEYDPLFPWQKKEPGTRYGYGVVIAENSIITTEDLIRNHTLLEIRKVRTGEKITAQLIASDYQVNLALLKVNPSKSEPALTPMALAPELKNGDIPNIYQFDANQQIQHGSGRVIETTMTRLPTAPYQTLVFRILSSLNVNAQGAAVVEQGGLAGLSMSYDKTRRVTEIIPVSTIRQFLDDALTSPYSGFASAGFIWRQLVDPAKRKFLNIENQGTGVIVLSCIPGTDSMDKLRADDVILEWDGHQIDNLGYCTHSKLGRIEFSYLIKGTRRPDDVVPLKIIRDMKELVINLKLCHLEESFSLIPENTTNKQAEYLLNGGFIFRELTGRYLQLQGRNWYQRVDPRLVRLYFGGKPSPEINGERVVIISDVLADPINLGYARFRNSIVTAVNKQPIHNITDVFKVFDKDGSITSISLKSIEVDIALDKESLEASNKRLMKAYNIPAARYQYSSKEE